MLCPDNLSTNSTSSINIDSTNYKSFFSKLKISTKLVDLLSLLCRDKICRKPVTFIAFLFLQIKYWKQDLFLNWHCFEREHLSNNVWENKITFENNNFQKCCYCRQALGPGFSGGQYCVVSLEVDAAPYMRTHFFLLFLAPVILCLVLMTRVSFGLQVWNTSFTGNRIFTLLNLICRQVHLFSRVKIHNKWCNRLQSSWIYLIEFHVSEHPHQTHWARHEHHQSQQREQQHQCWRCWSF